MTKEVVDKVTVTLKVSELSPDRLPYKPYGATFVSDCLFVEVEVPIDECLKYKTDKGIGGDELVILTPKGLAYMMDEICEAYEKVQSEHNHKLI